VLELEGFHGRETNAAWLLHRVGSQERARAGGVRAEIALERLGDTMHCFEQAAEGTSVDVVNRYIDATKAFAQVSLQQRYPADADASPAPRTRPAAQRWLTPSPAGVNGRLKKSPQGRPCEASAET